MRKIVYGILALLVVAVGAFLIVGPGIVESGMNKVVATPLPAISPRVRALHPRLAIADMHADTLLWQRNLLDPSGRGRSTCPGWRRATSRFRSSRR
jgi:membrane dipeptidase